MVDIARIDDEVLDCERFIKLLKLSGQFEMLLEDVMKNKLMVHAARKQRIDASAEEIQERADQLRRIQGLHRAADTNRWLDALGITIDDFEEFIVENLLQDKMLAEIGSDAAIQEYFQLNSPKFDSIEVSHIVLDSEGKAKEAYSVLSEDPDGFEEMAREYSLADTRHSGGVIGRVTRGALQGDLEAKVFNAEVGALLGPFPAPDGEYFEIFKVTAKQPASLNEETSAEIRRILRDEWLAARAREFNIEVL